MNLSRSFTEVANPPLWQEHAYERLKVLYVVGKLLSYYDDTKTVFPKVLSACANSFPFLTAILIESRGKEVTTAVWNANNATQEQIQRAISNAKESFIYLTGASKFDSDELLLEDTLSSELKGIHTENKAETTKRENYFVSPLVVDRLPAFGVLQLEGSVPLDEDDLAFVTALADLLAISVDRFNKSEEIADRLSRSQADVHDLEAERELREKFVSLLTHDLRTPLTAIKMSAEMIQRQSGNVQASQSFADRIVSSVDRTDRMISDLLDANRIRSGEKLPLAIENFDLSDLVKKTLTELTAVHGERFVLSAPAPINGYWDPKGIRRILENLCSNAVKYGSPNYPIAVSLSQGAETVIIEVQNRGEVISSEDQKYLFQQFHRGRKAASGKKKGWGIGLTLVLGVAEAHGGTVTVESEIETGTIFTVTLPMDSRPFLP